MCKSRSIATASLFAFSAITSFLSSEMWYRYGSFSSYCRVVPYLQCYYASLAVSNAAQDYWKCYIKVVTWMCSGFYWYICTLPWALHALRIMCIYQSNPSLPCYNLLIHICMCMFVCVCVTGYWKTDWNVTPGLFHFIGPADSHTHTLLVLTGLVDWSAFQELVLPTMWSHNWDNEAHGGH